MSLPATARLRLVGAAAALALVAAACGTGSTATRGLRIKWTKHNDFKCGGGVVGRVGVASGW